MRLPALGALLAVLAWLFAAPAHAVEDDAARLFSIYHIEVDVTASTAAQARRIALDRARERAWRRLVEKLAAPDSWEALPPKDPAGIEQMVRSMEISNERSSSTRYLAEIRVAFVPEAVRRTFDDAGIAYTESLGGPYLLLALFEHGGRRQLFGEHPWREALEAADPENRLIGYRFPEPSLANRARLSPLWLARAQRSDLAEIAEAFDIAQAVRARARPTVDPATGRLAVDYSTASGPDPRLEASGQVIAGADEEISALLERAADKIYAAADAAWKERTLLADRRRSRLAVMAPVRDFEDWLALRKRLEGVSLVRESEIERIALPLSRFSISYVGTREQLELALNQAQLRLETSDERHILRPAEQPGAREETQAEGQGSDSASGEAASDGDEVDVTPTPSLEDTGQAR